MKRVLKTIWHWGLMLGSGLVLILLTPVVMLLKLIDKFQKRATRRSLFAPPGIVLGSLGFGVVLIALIFYLRILPPFWSGGVKVSLIINPGESVGEIGTRLKEQDIISSPTLFRLMAKVSNQDKKIHAGKYEFRTNQSLVSILHQLAKGGATAINVTIPPGLTAKQIAPLFVSQLGIDTLRFVALCADRAFIQSLGLSVSHLEGFLYPETYNFYWKETEEVIIRNMVDQFKRVVFTELNYRPSGVLKDELKRVVTLASLIQKEGYRTEEFPLISAVFHNRLKIDMPLQCDPTVLYVLPPLNRPVRPADLQLDSPYNTYKYYGLPPGPICNPGKDALGAALNPAQVKYLFFVHQGDGSHIFSHTLQEHNRAIWMMKKKKYGPTQAG